MKENLLSVIIPVYNNKPSDIIRCLKSIEKGIPYISEIIIVDDGSKNECKKFLDQYTEKLKYLQVVHQKNQGPSAARNHGAKIAKGQYIIFVDADDVASKQFIQDLPHLPLDTNEYDIIYGMVKSSKTVDITNEKIDNDFFCDKLNTEECKQLYQHMIDLGVKKYKKKQMYISRGPYSRIVKKSFFLKHPFNLNLKHGEDMIWNLELLKYEPVAGIVYHLWYYYLYNANSISNKPNKDFVLWQKNMLKALVPYITKENHFAFMNRILESLHQIFISIYLSPAKKDVWNTMKDFNILCNEYPYSLLHYVQDKNGDNFERFIKFICYKARILFLIWFLKNRRK